MDILSNLRRFSRQSRVKQANLSQVGIIFRGKKVIFTRQMPIMKGSHLETFYSVEYDPEDDVFQQLRYALDQAPHNFFKGAVVNFSLPRQLVHSQKVLIPDVSDQDLELALATMVESADVLWDYHIFGQVEKESVQLNDVMILKVDRETIESTISVFEDFHLFLNRVVCEEKQITHFFETDVKVPMQRAYVVADISDMFLNLYVFKGDQVRYMRSIPLGYRELLQSMVRVIRIGDKDIQVELSEAHRVLKEGNLFKQDVLAADDYLTRLFFLVRPVMEKITIEIKKTISFYLKQTNELSMEDLFLMGQFVRSPNIQHYFRDELGVNCEFLDYHERIKILNHSQDPTFEESLCWGMAVGLQPLEDETFNFLPKDYLRLPDIQFMMKWLKKGFLILLFILLIMGSLTYMRLGRLEETLKKEQVTLAKFMEKHPQFKDKQKQIHSLERTDFLSQVYARRFPTHTVLYHLSQIDPGNVSITQMQSAKGGVAIEGFIVSKQAQLDLLAYVNKLRTIEGLSQLAFEISSKESVRINFVITGKLALVGGAPNGN